jgi:DNA-binding transcriptional LysR family regulator
MPNLEITRLDLNLLVVFDAMMRTGSVTAVSSTLGISQPNVSRSLRKLREFFGDELFIRASRGMQPTAKAMALREPVARAVEIVRRDVLDPIRFDPATSTRRFVLNLTDLGELAFVPKLLGHLGRVAPGIELECVCLGPRELLDAMRGGEVDLAIGYFPELTAQTVRIRTLSDHPFVCLARTGHPLLEGGLTVQAYARAGHIGLVGDGHAQRMFEERIARSGVARRIVLRTRNLLNVPYLVRETDLIATVPKGLPFHCGEIGGYVVLKPPVPIDPIPLAQYWTDRQHKDPGHAWLRRTVREVMDERDPTSAVAYW